LAAQRRYRPRGIEIETTDGKGSNWKVVGGLLAAGAAAITIVLGIIQLNKESDESSAKTWAADANGICTDAAQQLASVSQQIVGAQTAADAVAGYRQLQAVVRLRNDRLRELSPVARDEARVERMLSLSEQTMAEATTSAEAGARNDRTTAFAAADNAARYGERVAEIAAQLKVPRCRLEIGRLSG
jgi:hypothetical protein